MNRRNILLTISLLTLAVAAMLLATGSPLLVKALWNKSAVPAGTLITWAGLCAIPASIFLAIKRLRRPQDGKDRFFGIVFRGLMVLAVLWVPVSSLLSGNLSFTFAPTPGFQGSPRAGEMFWIWTYAVAAAPLVMLLLYGLVRLWTRLRCSTC